MIQLNFPPLGPCGQHYRFPEVEKLKKKSKTQRTRLHVYDLGMGVRNSLTTIEIMQVVKYITGCVW